MILAVLCGGKLADKLRCKFVCNTNHKILLLNNRTFLQIHFLKCLTLMDSWLLPNLKTLCVSVLFSLLQLEKNLHFIIDQEWLKKSFQMWVYCIFITKKTFSNRFSFCHTRARKWASMNSSTYFWGTLRRHHHLCGSPSYIASLLPKMVMPKTSCPLKEETSFYIFFFFTCSRSSCRVCFLRTHPF